MLLLLYTRCLALCVSVFRPAACVSLLSSTNSDSMVDHAEREHAGKRGKHIYNNVRKYTHMHGRTNHTDTHKHHPEVLHDWEVIKEAQRSVKVKGQRSNQSRVKH